MGITTDYHILGVDEKDKKYNDKIHYNQRLSYDDVIKHTKRAGIIIDIPQKNQSAFSIKVCEAIYYDKILITTDEKIKEAPFYDDKHMFYIKDIDDISEKMFRECNGFAYSKEVKDYFSVNRFINMVKKDLEVD